MKVHVYTIAYHVFEGGDNPRHLPQQRQTVCAPSLAEAIAGLPQPEAPNTNIVDQITNIVHDADFAGPLSGPVAEAPKVSRKLLMGCRLRPRGTRVPLRMGAYLTALSPAPEKVYREYKIPEDAWGMFGNDTIGDCTCAAIAHMLMMVTAHTGTLVVPDPKEVIQFYSEVSGYDPITGENDNGSDLPTVLDHWRDVGLSGHKIRQWGDIDPADVEAQKHGVHIFGAVDDAVALTQTDCDNAGAKKPWDLGTDNLIVGYHSIPRFGYGAMGATCVTWGALQPGGWPWWEARMQECCAVITDDWLKADGLTPSGFPMDALIADLKALGSFPA